MNKISLGAIRNTPVGDVWVAIMDGSLVAISLGGNETIIRRRVNELISDTEFSLGNKSIQDPTKEAIHQITQYFAGERTEFDIPINWSVMKPFQERALRLVAEIPYGKTQTYGEIAKELNQPNASRAVGHANATNPLPLVVPCHRVIGANQKMVGFSAPGGIVSKEWLLVFEGGLAGRQLSLF